MRFPPAWYPDPTGRHDHRWWDGVEWTAHVADAGDVGSDPLPTGTSLDHRAGPGTARPDVGVTDSRPSIATTAAAGGAAAVLLGWIPFVGLAIAAAALTFGIVARRRMTAGPGRRMATGGVAAAAIGLTIAATTTLVALTLVVEGSGGAIGSAARAYVACLEERPQQVCQRQLSRDLTEVLGG